MNRKKVAAFFDELSRQLLIACNRIFFMTLSMVLFILNAFIFHVWIARDLEAYGVLIMFTIALFFGSGIMFILSSHAEEMFNDAA